MVNTINTVTKWLVIIEPVVSDPPSEELALSLPTDPVVP